MTALAMFMFGPKASWLMRSWTAAAKLPRLRFCRQICFRSAEKNWNGLGQSGFGTGGSASALGAWLAAIRPASAFITSPDQSHLRFCLFPDVASRNRCR